MSTGIDISKTFVYPATERGHINTIGEWVTPHPIMWRTFEGETLIVPYGAVSDIRRIDGKIHIHLSGAGKATQANSFDTFKEAREWLDELIGQSMNPNEA